MLIVEHKGAQKFYLETFRKDGDDDDDGGGDVDDYDDISSTTTKTESYISQVVFIDIDAHYRNRIIFDTLLPRESSSEVFCYYILFFFYYCSYLCIFYCSYPRIVFFIAVFFMFIFSVLLQIPAVNTKKYLKIE